MRGSQSQEDGDVHPYAKVGGSWVEDFTQWLSENPEKVAEFVQRMRRTNPMIKAAMQGRWKRGGKEKEKVEVIEFMVPVSPPNSQPVNP